YGDGFTCFRRHELLSTGYGIRVWRPSQRVVSPRPWRGGFCGVQLKLSIFRQPCHIPAGEKKRERWFVLEDALD
ncbi:MAG: hypothetical protein ACPIOQ_67020, partial [Promethearchaeia archaeon]